MTEPPLWTNLPIFGKEVLTPLKVYSGHKTPSFGSVVLLSERKEKLLIILKSGGYITHQESTLLLTEE